MILFSCEGGHLALPSKTLTLVDRGDGGHLVVIPVREVWERSELTSMELTLWSFVVAAAGRAMLDVLPRLEGGCINYWEAGNWALNDLAEPRGPKTAPDHRRVHLHLLGRSPGAVDPSWRWGEAPKFPDYAARLAWAAPFRRLTADECVAVTSRMETLLMSRYGFTAHDMAATSPCPSCRYPIPRDPGDDAGLCPECREAAAGPGRS